MLLLDNYNTKCDSRQLLVLNVYRSPNSNLNVFLDKINVILDRLYKSNRYILLCGDINIDPNTDLNLNDSLSNMLTYYGLLPKIDCPTRVSSSSAYIIDQIYTNFACNKAVVMPNTVSDHETILINLAFETPTPFMNCEKHLFTRNNFDNFFTDLQYEKWESVYKNLGFQEKFNIFYKGFLSYFEKKIPKKTVISNNSGKTWVTTEVRLSSKSLKDLFSMKRDFPELKKIYKAKKKNILT